MTAREDLMEMLEAFPQACGIMIDRKLLEGLIKQISKVELAALKGKAADFLKLEAENANLKRANNNYLGEIKRLNKGAMEADKDFCEMMVEAAKFKQSRDRLAEILYKHGLDQEVISFQSKQEWIKESEQE